MKRLFFILGLAVSIGLSAQITELTHNTYGSQVRDRENTNFNNLQDSIDAVAAGGGGASYDTTYLYNTKLDGMSDSILVNNTMLQDSLGWVDGWETNAEAAELMFYNSATKTISYSDTTGWKGGTGGGSFAWIDSSDFYTSLINVKQSPYNATGDGSTDDLLAIQAAIDASVPYGRVFFPEGTYKITAALETKGSSLYGVDNRKSIISGNYDGTKLLVENQVDQQSHGVIENLGITGSNNGSNTDDIGVMLNNVSSIFIQRCRIQYCYRGIQLGDDENVSLCYIMDNDIIYNSQSGIYGRDISGSYLNAIFISRNKIEANEYGVDVVGNNITIYRNTIQGNDNVAIRLDAIDVGVTCTSTNTVISDNYCEVNGGGSVMAATGLISSVVHAHLGLIIRNNKFYDSRIVIEEQGTDSAVINFKQMPGSSTYAGFQNVEVCNNEIGGYDSYYFDGHNTKMVDRVTLEPKYNLELDEWINTSDATIKWGGLSNPAFVYETITGHTAIAIADVHPKVYLNATSAVDLSTTPCIPNGFNGQEIWFVGCSDTNTITFNDGNGIQLGASTRVLGAGDILKVTYVEDLGDWYEIGYFNN